MSSQRSPLPSHPRVFTWRHASPVPGVLAPGRYADDVMDQHASSWCGACYLVSAATMVRDRAHIALARAHAAHARSVRPPRLSLQTLLDHFRLGGQEEDEGDHDDSVPGWTACHGGFPMEVLACMRDGACPMVWEARGDAMPYEWWGFPRLLRRCPATNVTGFSVTDPRRIPPARVKAELVEGGTLVLEVSAQTLKALDARGVATDLAPRDADHAVCVVGWDVVSGEEDEEEEVWIVRNSWGTERVPREVPEDADACVARGRNACRVQWDAYRGDPRDPGFVLLPMSYVPLHAEAPSPWVAATVVVG